VPLSLIAQPTYSTPRSFCIVSIRELLRTIDNWVCHCGTPSGSIMACKELPMRIMFSHHVCTCFGLVHAAINVKQVCIKSPGTSTSAKTLLSQERTMRPRIVVEARPDQILRIKATLIKARKFGFVSYGKIGVSSLWTATVAGTVEGIC
jgi:hypothetical protein